jgi:hypothetical protein
MSAQPPSSGFLRDISTGPDNATFEPANAIALAGAVLWLVIYAHSYFMRGTPFDGQAFGIGLGAIIGSLGAAQRLRGDSK